MSSDSSTINTAAPRNTVLVVDDDIVVRLCVAGYLRECGYRVREASGGAEAIVLLQESEIQVDVVLCDIGPGDNPAGFELARWIRVHAPSVRVILAATAARAAAAAEDLCLDGPLMTKPYDHAILLSRIRQLLAAGSLGGDGAS